MISRFFKVYLFEFMQLILAGLIFVAIGFAYWSYTIDEAEQVFGLLGITISSLSLVIVILNSLSTSIDKRKERKITYISSRAYNKDLETDLKDKLAELTKDARTIDLIQMTEAVGHTDGRKEIFIIYH